MAVAVIHPGEHLSEELKELGMSAAELARNLGVPTNRITGILHGQRSITGDTALRLAHFFGTSAQFWLNLQSLYELRIAQEKTGRSINSLPRLESDYRQSRKAGAASSKYPAVGTPRGLAVGRRVV
jgi:addiction module HigA family antidote